ncbi:major facilitator superfamily domain-containing protein 6-like [Hyperolius riggenbachi]|uniref:major facilitator superfamily domain-containing protein 6-like n=1 Tax=Hyperolius riggenbachi TaxID=752182 RepID=UPI0035A2A64B
MSGPKQWDVSRALVIASLFNFLHNVGNFCIFPFLTIILRQFGLSPPLVGIIMGAKHIVFALWAPFCSFVAKTNSKRRIIIISSLFFSAGAGLALTIFQPLQHDLVFRFCNASLPSKNRLTTPGVLDMEMFGPEDNASLMLTEAPRVTTLATTRVTSHSKKKVLADYAIETDIPSKILTGLVTTTSQPSYAATQSQTSTTFKTLPKMHAAERLAKPNHKTRTNESASLELGASSSFEKSSLAQGLHEDLNDSTVKLLPHTKASRHLVPKKRDLNGNLLQTEPFLDFEHKTFLVVLGIVLIWEMFASPLKWTADDSLYEYLDFVDATDRHDKIWIWRYLGACLGSCSIVFLINELNCFSILGLPRVYLHFYSYSAFMFITLFLGTMYPIHVSKATEHTSKTFKALGLMGSDGHIVLLSLTVFIMGAVRSSADNFLFWQLQDIGSSELYMGLSVALSLFSEIVLYFLKYKLMKTFSFKWMVALGLFCQAIQLLYYSFLWSPWAVLPIQMLGAFSSSFLLWAVKSQVDDVATPGTERSIQLVLHCLSHQCGASVGSFAGGFVISSFSLPILFQACSVSVAAWILIFLVIQPKLPQTKKINYSRLLAPDNSDMSDSEDEQERDWLVKAMKEENKIW